MAEPAFWSWWIAFGATALWLFGLWMRRQRSRQPIEVEPFHQTFAYEAIPPFFDHAAKQLHAFVSGGYGFTVRPYPQAAEAISAFLRQVLQREPQSLATFHTVAAVRAYLLNPEWDADAAAREGWNHDHRHDCVATAEECLALPIWRDLAERGLNSSCDEEFYSAALAAEVFGTDVEALHWQRLNDKPTDPTRWFKVVCGANDHRMAAVIDFAESALPLHRIATESESGDNVVREPGTLEHCDATYAQLVALELVLEELHRFPGVGRALLLAGLNSSLVRSRHLALRALSAWSPAQLDAAMLTALHRAAEAEPHEPTVRHFSVVVAATKATSTPPAG